MAKYNEYMRNQIQELLTRHPNISIVWFDSEGFPFELWEGDALYRMIHHLRPDIIINDRCGLPGDCKSPEQHIGDFNLERDWESNMTFTGFWSWHGYQTKVIPFEECLTRLVRCAGGNGNLLMNIGPMPTGEIDTREADRLKRTGEWLKTHGESIYGTTGGPYKPGEYGVSTRKNQVVYLHVLKWPESGTVNLPAISANLRAAKLLSGGKVDAKQEGGRLLVSVAAADRAPVDTVVALTFDKNMAQVPVIEP
jgi:alpha-L-fucosidase